MTFSKMILISGVIGEAVTALDAAFKKGRITEANKAIAAQRLNDFEVYLGAKGDEYFPCEAASNTAAFELFRVSASKDFLAQI